MAWAVGDMAATAEAADAEEAVDALLSTVGAVAQLDALASQVVALAVAAAAGWALDDV